VNEGSAPTELTTIETLVVALLIRGDSYKQICTKLHIVRSTMGTTLGSISLSGFYGHFEPERTRPTYTHQGEVA